MPPSRKPKSSPKFFILGVIIILSLLATILTFAFPNTLPVPTELPASVAAGKKTLVEIGNVWIAADLAITEADRERGLSGRPTLLPGEGMLFVHPHSGQHAYWMKDMTFPIDIIWIDAERRIVGITSNISPESYPETFAPMVPALYVLEVPAGFARKNAFAIGQSVAF